jgi:hypothetical protein
MNKNKKEKPTTKFKFKLLNLNKMSNPKLNEMLSELRIEDTPSPPKNRRRVFFVEDTDSGEDLDQKDQFDSRSN